MKRITSVLVGLVLLGFSAFGQDVQISGKVTNAADGSILPGVSVVVKGTTTGITTNVNGEFSLSVPPDATLVFSFIGMQPKEVVVGNQTTINVAMEMETTDLEEVVVTALGISREKKSLGYSSQGVSGDDVMSSNDINPISSLSGKVAGLNISGQNFGGSQNILIRGASSFTNNNQPLFVVDGVPISNEGFNDEDTERGAGGYDYGSVINDLNSYDIANVEVLKGSAASALYGSRGQNGVIMITTKSGKKGKNKFSIEINSGMTFDKVSILPELQDRYGGGDGDFETVTIDGVDYQVVDFATDESWGPKYEGQEVLHWWGLADYEQGITDNLVTGEWKASENDVDSYYETGVTYQNSISITSSSEKNTLRGGYTNIKKTGIVPNSSQKKHVLNFNGSASVLDDIVELNTNINFVNTYTKGRPEGGYGDNSQSQKFFQWGQRQLDMKKLKNYKSPDGTQRVWNRTSWSDPTPKYSDNPYWTAYENYEDDDRTRIYGKTGLKVNITDYLFAAGTVYLDTYTWTQQERTAKGSQATSLYNKYVRKSTETNLEGKLNFKKNIHDFSILAMIGGNQRKEDYYRFQGESSGGLVIDGLYNLSNSADATTVEEKNREKKVNSWFGTASVGYKGLVYVDGTFRKDYDSSLPDGENSYGYSSVSGSFIASELIKLDIVDNLKVRVNYGETGNGTDPYKVYNVYYIDNVFNSVPQYSAYSSLNNLNLKPEETKEIELGLEGAFFRSRVGFDFSWYNRNTQNQIVPVEVSGSSGYTERYINAGKINNKGIELVLYGTPVKVGGFSWDISVNYAKNKNEVLDLPDGLDKIQLSNSPFSGAYLNAVEGATFQELYAYDYIYDDAGNKVIDQSTGFYATSGELTSMGSVLPDWTGGIRNTFRYKNFDIGALIDISKGGVYYSLTHMWSMYTGMAKNSATSTSNGNTIREDGIVLDGVTGDVTYDDDGNAIVSNTSVNTINISGKEYGKYFYHGNGTPSATSVFDASYIKLREVTLGYTLPKITDKIQTIRVSLYGRNLAIWGLDNKGIDPETIVNGNGNVQGLEGGIVPGTRSYGFNVNIKF